ncbi:glutathione S-transferase C-terminal domain-containing protein homolog isoform X1 [Schistocerca piceifrons]|nr:glutathione S-transferase C-terminal domain-containing protein homolog isoform X1 [Schistocerca piceifrons]
MDGLYVEVAEEPGSSANVLAPLETAVCLFAVDYLQLHNEVSVAFIVKKTNDHELLLIDISKLQYCVVSEPPPTSKLCRLPLILTVSGRICVAGLCSVLRQLVKMCPASSGAQQLLGFRQGCLVASAESSLWTRFCEVDMVGTVKHILRSKLQSGEVMLPLDLARFEIHMSQPVRIHNIGKQKNDALKCNLANVIEHTFSEGPNMTLADIMLLPCIHILFQALNVVYLKQHIPLMIKWYENMLLQNGVREALSVIKDITSRVSDYSYISYVLPQVEEYSLYKSDPKRYKPKSRIFTHQTEVEESLRIVSQLGIFPRKAQMPFGNEVPFDWSCLPYRSLPEGGNIPPSRMLRKKQQLENLAKAVLKIAKPGFTIVDFCSGTGHLGIILAYMLPRCRIVLLENKEESLNRAWEKVSLLGLSNIDLCQTNLDYFDASFDIGVSLHACGVATDLVIQCCITQKAAFVCCPCCYGGVQDNHVLCYPRSKEFRNSSLNVHDYLVLGHCADQTHGSENAKTVQGHMCMYVIDTDRCLYAKEHGYTAHIGKLIPETCTPKNNLIVGIPPGRKYLCNAFS